MKNLSILVPAFAAGVLVTASVLAAPQPESVKATTAGVMDRAAAYAIATAE